MLSKIYLGCATSCPYTISVFARQNHLCRTQTDEVDRRQKRRLKRTLLHIPLKIAEHFFLRHPFQPLLCQLNLSLNGDM